MKKYDVIVVGAGSAGLGNSGVANRLGLKTLVIEKDENNFGGDCTNYGCVPSKALIHIAHQFHAAKKASQFGLNTSGKADMQKVLEYIHKKQDYIKKTEDGPALRAKGIDVVIGEAKFINTNTFVVNNQQYTAKIIILCTGSSPRKLEMVIDPSISVYNNESIFFDCKTLPKNLVVIGGGPIGCELGQAFSRLGSKVHIISRGARILTNEPENVSRILETEFKKEGISILHNSSVKSALKNQVQLIGENGEETEIPCDAILVAIGRQVNTKGLDLVKAGIELYENGKIKVNPYFQTTNKHVYAIGDAAGSYMFSHGAEKMVRQLWRNLLIPVFRKKDTEENLSWVTFTDPQVAHFGYPEKKLQELGIDHYRQDQSFEHDDRAIIQEYQYGHSAIWFDGNKNLARKKILSGTMIAPHAGELIQEMELAKHAKIHVKSINNRVYPYPVATRINQKLVRGLMAATQTNFKLKLAKLSFRIFH